MTRERLRKRGQSAGDRIERKPEESPSPLSAVHERHPPSIRGERGGERGGEDGAQGGFGIPDGPARGLVHRDAEELGRTVSIAAEVHVPAVRRPERAPIRRGVVREPDRVALAARDRPDVALSRRDGFERDSESVRRAGKAARIDTSNHANVRATRHR